MNKKEVLTKESGSVWRIKCTHTCDTRAKSYLRLLIVFELLSQLFSTHTSASKIKPQLQILNNTWSVETKLKPLRFSSWKPTINCNFYSFPAQRLNVFIQRNIDKLASRINSFFVCEKLMYVLEMIAFCAILPKSFSKRHLQELLGSTLKQFPASLFWILFLNALPVLFTLGE